MTAAAGGTPEGSGEIAAAGSKLVERMQRRKNAAADKQGKIVAAVRRSRRRSTMTVAAAPIRHTTKNLLLQQGFGKMRPIAAATGSGSTLLAGTTRAREPERVWNGRLATALQQKYAC